MVQNKENNNMQKEWIGKDKGVFLVWQKYMDLLYLKISNKNRLHATLLKISCYKCAPKTHGTFKCDKCALKQVISWYRCTPKTFSRCKHPRMYPKKSLQSLFWEFLKCILKCKNLNKNTKNWNDVKVDIFLRVQVKGALHLAFLNTFI
jgi:hypothetical protein